MEGKDEKERETGRDNTHEHDWGEQGDKSQGGQKSVCACREGECNVKKK